MPKLAERMLLTKQVLEQSLIQRRKELRLARMGPRVMVRPAARARHEEPVEHEVKSHRMNVSAIRSARQRLRTRLALSYVSWLLAHGG